MVMFNAPMSQHRAEYLIEALGILPQQIVVDFGCGDGAFLQQLASQVAITGVGIDKDTNLIQKATSGWTQMDHESTLNFIATDVNTHIADMDPVDVIICIGAEYIFGGYANMLSVIKPLLKPNGKLLVGTIYWKQAPPADYLSLLGDEDPYFDLLTTVDMAYQASYLPLDIGRANDDEWDRFESFTARKRYQDVAARNSTWRWQHGYLKWGMNTMGFCFLVLEKLSEASAS